MSTANIRLVTEALRIDCQDQNTKRRLNGLNYLLIQHSYLSFVSPCSSCSAEHYKFDSKSINPISSRTGCTPIRLL